MLVTQESIGHLKRLNLNENATAHHKVIKTLVFKYEFSLSLNENATARPRILDLLVLQDKTLFCVFEAGDIYCLLIGQSADCKVGLVQVCGLSLNL